MAKMFYTTDEAAAKLSVNSDRVKDLVGQNRLREFRDGNRVMFKVDQVDRLSDELKSGTVVGGIGGSDTGIGLASPGDSGISLADADAHRPANTKEDTVVTGQGVNVLDSSEVKPADANMQTQIQTSPDEGLSPSSMEGVGSGSGLLDLTRESDDTSLGAELLDEIYPGGEKKHDPSATGTAMGAIGSGSGLFAQVESPSGEVSGPSGLETMAAGGGMGRISTVIEAPDPSAGAFGGMALGSALVMALTAVVAASAFVGASPEWVKSLSDSWPIFIAILVVVVAAVTGIGFFTGKAAGR